jgi:hypothetical protein
MKAPNTLLLHGHSVQVALITVTRSHRLPELLARVVHACMHPSTLLERGVPLLSSEQLPRAVDCPVTQPPQTTHTQRGRRGREHVLLEDLDARIVLGADRALVFAVGAHGFGFGGSAAFAGAAF